MGRASCCDKIGVKKGPWTPEEDRKLIDYIQKHGQGSWRTLPKKAGTGIEIERRRKLIVSGNLMCSFDVVMYGTGLARCGKSCRLRWTNYLRPDIKRGRFSFEEEEAIIQLHSVLEEMSLPHVLGSSPLGFRWSKIAACLPGRTDNEIKNYWNTCIRKRLLRMGIDPVTHAPRLDLLDLSSFLTASLCNPASQFDFSRLLVGPETIANTHQLKMATDLLSSQRQSSNILGQGLQEQPYLLASLQEQQLQLSSQQLSTCTLPNEPFIDEALLMQASAGQFQPAADSNRWTSASYQSLDPSFTPLVTETSNLIATDGQGYDLTSLLSTPASSSLNSSSTYGNQLKYQIPSLLDVSKCM
ncbi:hypothetical protein B296_00034285 [Ensete ventricosum]|uniref:Uncharacterized protein n=1 Tax=Ensete ventricosum TaxID=4639 RepID=A0A426XIY6_ENSVE|nr:hypothetical protein B296_00034285 [Ensete ventricosum]